MPGITTCHPEESSLSVVDCSSEMDVGDIGWWWRVLRRLLLLLLELRRLRCCSSGRTGVLHIGQHPWRSVSHGRIQSVWNAWLQRGRRRSFSPSSNSSKQIEQHEDDTNWLDSISLDWASGSGVKGVGGVSSPPSEVTPCSSPLPSLAILLMLL